MILPSDLVGKLKLVGDETRSAKSMLTSIKARNATHRAAQYAVPGVLGAGASLALTANKAKGIKRQIKYIKANRPKDVKFFGKRIPNIDQYVADKRVESLTGDLKKVNRRRVRDAAITGTVTGAVVGTLGPKAVGRVTTNLISPYGYDATFKLQSIKDLGFKRAVEAVIKDKPNWAPSLQHLDEDAAVREFASRRMFGLKPRESVAPKATIDKLIQKNKDGTYSFKPGTDQHNQLQKDSYKGVFTPNVSRRIGPGSRGSGGHLGTHSTLGDYYRTISKDRKTMTYTDYWDIGLDRGEKILTKDKKIDKANLGRAVLHSISTPPIFHGKVNARA